MELVVTEVERPPGSGESPRVSVTVEAKDQFGLPYPLEDAPLRLEISNLDVAESSHTLRFVDGRAHTVLSLDPSRHRLDGSTVLRLIGPGEIVHAEQSLPLAAAMPRTVTLQLIGEAPRQSLAGELLSLSLRVTVQDNYGRPIELSELALPIELSELVLAIAADNGTELTTERVTLSVGADGNAEISFGVKPRGRDSVVTVRVVSGLPEGMVQAPPAGLRIPLRAAAELRSLRIELLGESNRAVFTAEQEVDIRLRMTPEYVAVVPTQTVVVVQVLPVPNPLGLAIVTQSVTLAGATSTVVTLSVYLGEGRQMSTLRIAVQGVFFVGVPAPTVLSPDRLTLVLVPEVVELTVATEQLQVQRRGGEVVTTATVLARGVPELFPLRALRLQHLVSGPAVSLSVEPEPFVLVSSGSTTSLRLRLRQSYAAAEGTRSTVTLTVHLAALPQLRLDSAELVLLSAVAAPSTVTLRLIDEAPRQSQAGELLSPRLRISVHDNYGRPLAWPPLSLTIAADNEAELTTERLTVAIGPDGIGESSFGVTPRGLDSLVTVRALSPLAMDPAEGLRFRVAAAIDIVAEDLSDLLTVGHDHACVVHRDTTVRCSGAGALGRLGNGGTADSTTPVRVLRLRADAQPIALAGIRRVVSGSRYNCALAAEGSVWCWGEGFSQYAEAIPLGVGPARLEDAEYLDVEASLGCAIRLGGEIWCWDMLQQPFEPQRIKAIDNALLLSLGDGYGCALTESREVFCWGMGAKGQLGDGRMSDSPDTGRRVVLENGEPLADIIRLSAGLVHACALSAAGGVFCWGENTDGAVSGEVMLADTSIVPAAVAVREFSAGMERSLSGFSSVAAGAAFSCGIQAAGAIVRCWGSELYGDIDISYGAFGSGPPLLDRSFTITTAVLTLAEGHPALGDVRLVAASPGQLPSAPSKVWALDHSGDLWSWGVSDSIRELSIFDSMPRMPTELELETFRNNFYYADRLGDFNIYRGGIELSSVSMTVAATVQQRVPRSAVMVPVQVDAIDQYGLPYPLEVPGLRLEISELVNIGATDGSHTLRLVDGRVRMVLSFELLRGGTDGSALLRLVGPEGIEYARQSLLLLALPALSTVQVTVLSAHEYRLLSAQEEITVRLRLDVQSAGDGPPPAETTMTLRVVDAAGIERHLRNVVVYGRQSTEVSLVLSLAGVSDAPQTVLSFAVDVGYPLAVLSPDRVTLRLVPERVELSVTDSLLQAAYRGAEVQTMATVLVRGDPQLFPLSELRLQHMVSGPAASLIVEPEPFVLRSSGSSVSLRLRLRQPYALAEGTRTTVTLTVHLAALPQLRLDSAELVLLAAAAAPSTVTLRLIGEAPRQSQAGELLSPRLRISVHDNYGRPLAWPPLSLTIAADNEAELTTERLTVAIGPGGVGESSFGVTPRGLDSLVTVRALSPLAMDPAGGLRFRVAAAIDIVAEDRSGLVTVGFDHACVVHRDTTVRCTGAGSRGRLGNGGTADSTTPVRVLRLRADAQPIALAGIRRVVSGSRYSCALAAEGSVWCWGEGFSQYAEAIPLGTGPAQLEDAEYLDVEASLGCAIRSGGEVWCWDMLQQPFEPRRIEAIDDALLLSLGIGYGCALTESREVFCWGMGTFGQLGDGRVTDSLDTGRRVVLENGEPLADIIRLSAGLIHVCALSAAGGVFCWGDNTQGVVSGEAILGDTFIVPAAVAVREFRAGIERPLSGFSMVAAGAAFNCGIQAAGGGVRCWGQEEVLSFPLSFGAFGDGSTLNTIQFRITTAVLTVADGHPALGDVRLVAASPGERRGGDNRGFPGYKVWALDALGDLWSWGASDYERESLAFLRFRSRQGLSTATTKFTEDLHYAARLGDFNIYRGGVELSSVTMTVAATVQQRVPGSAVMVPVQVDAIDQYGLPYPLEVPDLRLEISELVNIGATDGSHTLRLVDGWVRMVLSFELLRGGADGSALLRLVGSEGIEYAQQSLLLLASPALSTVQVTVLSEREYRLLSAQEEITVRLRLDVQSVSGGSPPAETTMALRVLDAEGVERHLRNVVVFGSQSSEVSLVLSLAGVTDALQTVLSFAVDVGYPLAVLSPDRVTLRLVPERVELSVADVLLQAAYRGAEVQTTATVLVRGDPRLFPLSNLRLQSQVSGLDVQLGVELDEFAVTASDRPASLRLRLRQADAANGGERSTVTLSLHSTAVPELGMVSAQLSLLSAAAVPSTVTLMLNGEVPRQSFAAELLSLPLRLTIQDNYGRPMGLPELVLAIAADNGAELTTERVTIGVGTDGKRVLSFGVRPRGLDSVVTVRVVSGLPAGVALVPPEGLRIPLQAVGELRRVRIELLGAPERAVVSADQSVAIRLRLTPEFVGERAQMSLVLQALNSLDEVVMNRDIVFVGEASTMTELAVTLGEGRRMSILRFDVLRMSVGDVLLPTVLSPDRVTLRLVPETVELTVAAEPLQARRRGGEVLTTATLSARGASQLFPLRALRLQHMVSGAAASLIVEPEEFVLDASDSPVSLRLRLRQSYALAEGTRTTVTLTVHSAAFPQRRLDSAELVLLSAAAAPSTVTLQLINELPRQSQAGELLSPRLRISVRDNYGRPVPLPALLLAITADNEAELTTSRLTVAVGPDGVGESSFGVTPRGLDSLVTVRVLSPLAMEPAEGLRIPLQAVGELRRVRIELLGAPERAVISTDQSVAIQLRLTPEFVGEDAQMSLVLQVLDPLDEVVLSRDIVLVGEASTMTELAVTLGDGRRMRSLRFDVLRMPVGNALLPMVLSPDRVTLRLVPEAVELTVAAKQLQARQRGGEVVTTATLSARGASQLFPLRALRLQHMVSGPAASLIVEPDEFVLDAADSPVSVRLRLRQSYAAAEGALSTVTLTVHPAAFPQLRLDSAELVLLSAAAAPSTVTLRLIGEAPRQSQAGELLSPRLRISVRDNYGRSVALPELVLGITANNGAKLQTSMLTVVVGPGGVGESSFGVTPQGMDSLVTVRVLSPLAMEPPEGLRFRVAAVIDVVAGDRSGLLTVGFDHACVVHHDTTVRCVGAGADGQLGNGGRAAAFAPVRVLRRLADGREIALAGVRQVVSGSSYSCALAAEGSVWCWGEGFSQDAEAIPLGMGPAQLEDVKYLDVESALGCAIRATGEVWCWDLQQQPFEPQRIEAIDDALLLSLGDGYGCALTELREVFCWGMGAAGQLGDGSMTDSPNVGRQVVLADGEPLADIIRLSVGQAHTCALSAVGSVLCWGNNFAGSVSGEVKPADSSVISIVPTAVPVRQLRGGMELPLSGFSSVAAGVGFSCGIQSAAAVVRCWGSEFYVGTNISYGAFGSGPPLRDRSFMITTAVLTVAEGHPALGNVRLVAASPGLLPSAPSPAAPSKVWAVDNFGDLWSWGVSDSIRELSIFDSAQRTPTESELETFRSSFYYANRLGDFNIFRGGVELSSVSLTVAATVQQRRPGDALMVPVQVDAIDQDGLPYPLEVPGLRLQLSDLVNTSATDSSHTLRFVDGRAELRLELHLLQPDTDGALTLSVVGGGTVHAQQRVELRARRSDVPVFALNLQLAAGISHACVLHDDTTVRCLGNPERGQLGRGRLPEGRLIKEPLPVLRLRADGAEIALAGMLQVVSSWNHSCALSAAGSVWCWGAALGNYASKIAFSDGDGTAAIEDVTYVDTYTSIRQLNLGIQARVCLIRRDGTIWCGFVSGGPLAVPMNRIAGVNSAVQLELGELFGCAVTRSGNVFCWGIGDRGQLGNGQQLSSVDVGQQVILQDTGQPLSGIVQLTAGLQHACALGSNGKVFCWGNNVDGVVSGGLRERELHAAAVPVREVHNEVARPLSGMGHLAGALSYNCGIRSADGFARCWGSDFEHRVVVGGGNFGRGPSPNRASITPVFTVTTAVLTVEPGHPPLQDLLSVSACPAFGGVAALPLKVWAMDVFGDLWHWGFTVNYILAPDNAIAGEDELYANRLPNFNRYRDGVTISTVQLTVPELVRQTDPGAALPLAIGLEAFDQFQLPFPLPNADLRLELGDWVNAEADQSSHELPLEDGWARLNLQLRLLEQGIAGEVVLRVTAAGIEYARQRVRLQALPVLSSLSLTVVEEPQPPTEIGAVVDFVVAVRAIGKDGRMIAAEDVLLSARLDGSGELLAPIGESLALAAAAPTTRTVLVVPRAARATTVTVSVSSGDIVASLQRRLSGVELISSQTSIVARLTTDTIMAGREFGLVADYLAPPAEAQGLRAVSVHLFYDSDLLTYTGLADVLEDDLVMRPERVIVMADRGNQDGDPDTDRVLSLRWSAPLGIWQTVELPAQLFEALLVSRGFRSRETDTTVRLLATVDAVHLRVAPVEFSILSSAVRFPRLVDGGPTGDGGPIGMEEVILAHRFLNLHEGQSAGMQPSASQLQALFANMRASLSADRRMAVLRDLQTLLLPEAGRVMDVSGDAALTSADTRMLLRYLASMRGKMVFGNFDQENAERILQIGR